MTVLLEKIRAEIGVRLQESRAAVDEYERLEAALAALGGPIRARRLKPPAAKSSAPVEDSPPVVEAAPEPVVAAEEPPAAPLAEAPPLAEADAASAEEPPAAAAA